jgi:1,3-beta-glucan synthase component
VLSALWLVCSSFACRLYSAAPSARAATPCQFQPLKCWAAFGLRKWCDCSHLTLSELYAPHAPQIKACAPHACYRVRLPVNPESGRGVVLGEGKPENQNHAIIFCFNETLQAIDMNQVPPIRH